ncbi:hypothetical protein K504DRAFT_467138 [Pleomassaria siparia CBS 279.74]|uniref:SWR1-complex protein 4 n=1 Tax=Pleomassaria siparia CBS 279.74 TaxID=1314801 RepID=A0A6G1K8Q9_9PLEO|nr:hypothetical protein K504DRAFT_467138 [Pleomassaria siparia CBS 279.74]
MASGRDVREMLGLPGFDGPKTAPAAKRSKAAVPGKKIQGVAREVAALYGERPPPVAVYEEKKSYRAKRQSTGPAKKWVLQPFTNQARSDGLVLKHWRRKPTSLPTAQSGEDIAIDEPNSGENTDVYIEDSGEFLRYAVQPDMPTFSDEEYNMHLRSDDWSREETDYLFQMISDFAYRWPVVWDRYEYKPSSNSHLSTAQDVPDMENPLATMPYAPSKSRSVEDLKARFYDISAKLMKLRIPEVQMDADQYATYEILTKFDPVLERNRKNLAAALMNRNMDEVKEEEFLLAELQRINMAANRLDAEREELRSRLEAPVPNTQVSAGLASFTSSTALAQLFSQLFQQDRSKKRAAGGGGGGGAGPGRLSLSAADHLTNTPTSTSHGGALSGVNRRQSLAQPAIQTPVRHLSPNAELRYNVSTHERLTSGITFGADKLLKMRQAKSNVQTQKIGQALAQLGIADIISIPTARVGDAFESLITKVSKLLDVRKVREKEEGECRVLEAMKARRMSEIQGDDDDDDDDNRTRREIQDSQERESPSGNGEDDDDADADADADGDADGDVDVDAEGEEEEDEDAEGEDVESQMQQSTRQASEAMSTRATSTGHKRSASVLSQTSTKSNKRARK